MVGNGASEEEKCNFLLVEGSYVGSQHLLRPYVPLMQGGWPKPEVVNRINLST